MGSHGSRSSRSSSEEHSISISLRVYRAIGWRVDTWSTIHHPQPYVPQLTAPWSPLDVRIQDFASTATLPHYNEVKLAILILNADFSQSKQRLYEKPQIFSQSQATLDLHFKPKKPQVGGKNPRSGNTGCNRQVEWRNDWEILHNLCRIQWK